MTSRTHSTLSSNIDGTTTYSRPGIPRDLPPAPIGQAPSPLPIGSPPHPPVAVTDGTTTYLREWIRRDLPPAPIGQAPSPLSLGPPPPTPVATSLLSRTSRTHATAIYFEDVTYTHHIDGRIHTTFTSYSRVRTTRDLSDPPMTNWTTVLAELINTVPQLPPLNPVDHIVEARVHNMAMMFGTIGRDLLSRESI